ncbi:sushi, von Willebrand factor type A, EGF and pentraxin domain-containing protein 1-like [Mercenaria mercenaria]|uniref:sushi, von Willebrand factor type A, EGF and pentraxin domain-containing protein 1-like n=1 Tax=Mercenaria mercenaria TaxID=6596 RepID=UPI00234E3FF8|nr:sushi, von Willebrand factor type A, EGF and pentraxin domain-containing protein 1-like [Mercenaria mercenaria]
MVRKQDVFLTCMFILHVSLGAHTPAAKVNPAECRSLMDLYLVVDGSDSISYPDFNLLKRAIENLIPEIDLGHDKARIGMLVYSSDVPDQSKHVFSYDRNYLINAARTLQHPREGTKTWLGIKHMQKTFKKHGRDGVPWVCVVITDGISKNRTATIEEADKAAKMGISMFAVGIGHKIAIEELEEIASTTNQVMAIKDFSELQYMLQTMMFRICPCPVPPTLPLAKCNDGPRAIGSVRTYQCAHGYLQRGNPDITCQGDFTWTDLSADFECVPCGVNTPVVKYGTCSGGDNTIGTVRTYSCNKGYRPMGDPTTKCMKDATWSIPSFECVPCGSTPAIVNGICGSGKFTIGAHRTLSCKPGYRAIGKAEIVCLDDPTWDRPQWSVPDFKCVPCGNTPAITHGICGDGDFMIGAHRTLSCKPGYRAIGKADIVCLDDPTWDRPQWSVPDFQCVPCGNTPSITHGICGDGDFMIGSHRTLSCKPGYRAFGKADIVCLDDPTWDRPQWSVPDFQCVPCGNTPAITHGICGDGDFMIGAHRTLSCKPGYRAIGKADIVCLDNPTWDRPQWSVPDFQCVPCGNTPAITHGICGDGDFMIGAHRTLSCKPGYRAIGKADIVCLDDPTWDRPQWSVPDFQCVPCGNTPAITHGICGDGDFMIGAHRTLSCKPGYRAIGKAEIVCLDDPTWDRPQWSVPDFQCVPCGNTPAITHGICSDGAFVIGAHRTLSCKPGYRAIGKADIVCLDDPTWDRPQWSVPDFQCVPCGNTPVITHGICGDGDFMIGSHRTLSCKPGYRAIGIADIVCLDDPTWDRPQWSVPDFQCVPCGNTPAITHGICGDGDFMIGSHRTLSCKPGYRAIGIADIVCLDDPTWDRPQWSVPDFQCVPCGNTPAITHGICGDGDFMIGSHRTLSCKPGYRAIGIADIVCLDDPTWDRPQWSVPDFQCVPCGNTPSITHGICGDGDFMIGSHRTLSCKPGYRAIGKADIVCLDDPTWDRPQWSVPDFQCVPCGNTPAITHGICGDGDFMIGAHRTLSCKPGYRAIGKADIVCLDDPTWDRPQWSVPDFQCVPCGNTPSITHGICGDGDFMIGSHRTLSCKPGYRAIGKADIVCLDDPTWDRPQWSVPDFQCVPCGNTPSITHGICGDGDFMIGSHRTLSCKPGYRAIGIADIVCLDDPTWDRPQWSVPDFQCVPCGNTPAITHGICGDGDFMIGAHRTLSCKPGYRAIGKADIVCLDDPTWDRPQWSVPDFQCVPCGNTPAITHGICGDGDFMIGSHRTLSCKPGYRAIGKQTSYALMTRLGPSSPDSSRHWYSRHRMPLMSRLDRPQWSVPDFQCVPCGNTPDITHGICGDGEFMIGAHRTLSCKPGYRAIGKADIVCLDDPTWDRPQWSVPDFQCVPCGNTPAITHGICGDGDFMIGSHRTLSCKPGYRAIGKADIVCLDDPTWDRPQWSVPDFQCVPCGNTPDITHGICGDGEFMIGSHRTLSCKPGYRAIGKADIVCLDDPTWDRPQWSVPDFQCVPCGDTPVVDHATCNDGDNLLGSRRTYTCENGYVLEGTPAITCQDNASWSIPQFRCKDCGDPPVVANAYTGIGPSTVGTERVYYCESGFKMAGRGKVMCKRNGKWQKPNFSCEGTITTPPSKDPNVCDGCRYMNGVGYNNHPYDCNQFVQCFKGRKGLEPIYRKCPFGLFWDQTVLTCRPSDEVNCPHDRCKDPFVHSYKHNDPNKCCAYWKCQHGRSFGECCGDGSSYSPSKQRCVPDYECKATCPFQDEIPACDKQPAKKDTQFKQYIGNGHWTTMDCAPGTAFNPVDCKCSLFIMSVPGEKRRQVCKPEIYLPFSNGFQDRSGKNVYIKPENVTIHRGAAYFNGNSRILINRFANTEFAGNLVIKFRYNEFRQGSYFNELQALVTNGDCGSDPSIVIAKMPGHVLLGAKARASTSFALPTLDKEWKEVIYIHNTKNLEGRVCGASKAKWSYGHIKGNHCAMQIGYGSGLQSYVGLIDDFYVYQCRPRAGLLNINY